MADYEQELKDAYERLKPYYQKMLEMAGGDINLAKRMIEADYTSGKRENEEEAQIKRRELALQRQQVGSEYEMGMGEAKGAYGQALKEQQLLFPQEQEQMWTGLNRRGVSQGGLAGAEAGRLKESQTIRREAVDRALKEREVRLTTGKKQGEAEVALGGESTEQRLARALGVLGEQRSFGLEKADRGLARETQTLSKTQEQEAAGMASDAYNRALALQQMEMQKKAMEEQSRISEIYGQTAKEKLSQYY
jgi:hypothetical protein